MREKSKVYSVNDDELKELVENSKTYSEVLFKLGLTTRGGNSSRLLKQRIKELSIDVSHFIRPVDAAGLKQAIPLCDILIENSKFTNTACLKKKLIKEGKLEYICEICGNQGEWNGKKLVLQLDHKNGIHNDNRLENLRFLCPNCHSQTDTYAGKNVA